MDKADTTSWELLWYYTSYVSIHLDFKRKIKCQVKKFDMEIISDYYISIITLLHLFICHRLLGLSPISRNLFAERLIMLN